MTQDIVFSILPGQGGNIGEILLNRPKALNALTLEMCQLLGEQLRQWKKDDQIKGVIIRGEGDRAFCAGGDIRFLYSNGEAKSTDSENFFLQEYSMNKEVFHFNKPYISLLDGITMGGGVGVSIHGSHRVATERLMLAMPETGIGFFPDIGAGYFLSRCTDKMGYYLGLTGDRIQAADAQQLGLVTHVVSSSRQLDLIQALMGAPFSSDEFETVSSIIDQFSIKTEPPQLNQYKQTIADCFGATSVEDIMLRLEEVNDTWSLVTRKVLADKSPTSLKVTFEQLNRSGGMEFDDVMQMEFNIALQFLKTPDFFEGVRAIMIDKDQAPKWQPSRLEDVTKADMDRYFAGDSLLSL